MRLSHNSGKTYTDKDNTMAQLKKPTPKRPMAPRIPSTGVKKPLSKASDAKAKFEKDFKSGKMKVNAGEIISPGKIVAKLATKVAAKVAIKSEAKANARGLKAATGKLSKSNQKLVKQVGEKTNYIVMDRRPTPPSIDKILKTNKNFGAFKAPEQVKEGMKAVYAEGKKIAMQEARTNSAPKKISTAQKALNKKLGKN